MSALADLIVSVAPRMDHCVLTLDGELDLSNATALTISTSAAASAQVHATDGPAPGVGAIDAVCSTSSASVRSEKPLGVCSMPAGPSSVR